MLLQLLLMLHWQGSLSPQPAAHALINKLWQCFLFRVRAAAALWPIRQQMRCRSHVHHHRMWDVLELVEWQLAVAGRSGSACMLERSGTWVGEPGCHLLHEWAKAAGPLLNGCFVRVIYLQQIKTNGGENSQATAHACMHTPQAAHTTHIHTTLASWLLWDS